MRTVTVEQIQALDRLAIKKFGISSLVLMENAGRRIVEEVLRILRHHRGRGVSIFCGTGNNGGDGFVAARHLINAGIKVDVFCMGKPAQLKNDAAVNYKILKRSGFSVHFIYSISTSVKKVLKNSVVLVDALFGVGLNRPLSEPFSNLVDALNISKKPIVAVDIPSGLDGNTGDVFGNCIRAHTTITFTLAKKGLSRKFGPRMAGRLKVVDIGIPQTIIKKIL